MLYRFRNTCLRWAKRWRMRCGVLGTAYLAGQLAYSQPIGSVDTLGGIGSPGYKDGVKGVSEFHNPTALALRDDDTLFIADTANNAVRKMRLSDTQTFPFVTVDHPVGLAFDSKTNLFVAKQSDGTIVKYDYFSHPRQTNKVALTDGVITAVAIDRHDNLYVAQLNGVITVFDSKGVAGTRLHAPTPGVHEFRGVTVTDDGVVFASDAAAHVIWRFKEGNGELFAGTLNLSGNAEGEVGYGQLASPQQIAIGPNGSVVIADRGNHQVRIASCDGIITILYGAVEWYTLPDGLTSPEVLPGWDDSTAEFAELREPVGVAVDSNGTVFDSEVYYNLIRTGTGLYVPPPCSSGGTTGPTDTPPVVVLDPNSGFFPNGVTIILTASNSVTFSRDTHLYYTLNGAEPTKNDKEIEIDADGRARLKLDGPIDLAGLRVRAFLGDVSGPVAAALPTQVPNCVITPDSGYYPMGADIAITSTNGFPEGTLLNYTLDGTLPTTNSPSIPFDGTRGLLTWRDATKDLRSLKVRAFLGPNQGAVSAGKAVSFPGRPDVQGEVGVAPARRGYRAGIGSFYILPIIANMRDNQQLKSVSFNIELSALPGSPHLEATDLVILPMSTNDFIQVLPASTFPPNIPVKPFARNGTNNFGVSFGGTDNSFNVSTGYATVAIIGIQFRAEDSLGNKAEIGNGYKLGIRKLSGTSDGIQQSIALAPMDDITIRFENIKFREGDTAPTYWYNAGDFGDDLLDDADKNNAIFASFGFLRPFSLTDSFAAMDVYRVGLFENVVEFNDAATVLRRVFGYESSDFFRVRDENGEWQSSRTLALPLARQGLRALSTETPAWTSDVTISAGVMDKVLPIQAVSLPVYIKTAPGVAVSGMQFVADLVPANGAPPVTGVSFSPSSDLPQPNPFGSRISDRGVLPSTVYARWDNLSSVKGTVLLGYVQFVTPSTVQAGQHYNLVFHDTGGAAIDDNTGALTPYIFQSIHGEVWPFASAPATPQIADEWTAHFFGSAANAEANPDEDPDGDGFTNIEEFLGGTDPNAPDWHVKAVNGNVLFRWLGRVGKSYTVEKTEDFRTWNAVSGRMTGQDTFLQYNELTVPGNAQFYRLNIQ